MISKRLALSETRSAGGSAGFIVKTGFRIGLVTFEMSMMEVSPEERSGLEIGAMASHSSELCNTGTVRSFRWPPGNVHIQGVLVGENSQLKLRKHAEGWGIPEALKSFDIEGGGA